MTKIQMVPLTSLLLLLLSGCGLTGNSDLNETYICKHPDGRFGAKLQFQSGGKMVLDFISDEILARSPELIDKNNIQGKYTIDENIVTINYFEGSQEHRLVKNGDTMQHEVKALQYSIFDSCEKI